MIEEIQKNIILEQIIIGIAVGGIFSCCITALLSLCIEEKYLVKILFISWIIFGCIAYRY